MTALSGELGRLAGMDCGANAYLTKPFSPRALIARVEEILGSTSPDNAATT